MTMEFLDLRPEQLITSNYSFLHDPAALQRYFDMYQDKNNHLVPPIPVIRKDLALRLSPVLQQLAVTHQLPAKSYFLVDGSHRTTAACLTHQTCRAMVFASDADIAEAKEMKRRKEIFPYQLGDTFQDELDALAQHFIEKPGFQSVVEKTEKLIAAGEIPAHMVSRYQS